MKKGTTIDVMKQDSPQSLLTEEQNKYLQERHDEIIDICCQLSESTQIFSTQKIYDKIDKYIRKYGRWLYSDISTYLFRCDETEAGSFITNLDDLLSYTHNRYELASTSNDERRMLTAIEKLWDHSNLAQSQSKNLHDNEETFKQRFEKHLIPFKSEFARDMNMQFISLIAIFTALSFIVFGGITALDNIFSGVLNIPILELIIVGCIWSLCILNLVFVFMFFVSKLTHISIKSSDKDNASISEKYPFAIWCNYVLLIIFASSCWLYYIDYSNSGGWLIQLSKRYPIVSFVLGLVIIALFSIAVARLILHRRRKSKKSDEKSPG